MISRFRYPPCVSAKALTVKAVRADSDGKVASFFSAVYSDETLVFAHSRRRLSWLGLHPALSNSNHSMVGSRSLLFSFHSIRAESYFLFGSCWYCESASASELVVGCCRYQFHFMCFLPSMPGYLPSKVLGSVFLQFSITQKKS